MSANLIIRGTGIYIEKRFSLDTTLEELKSKLYFITGIPEDRQILSLLKTELKVTTLVGFPNTPLRELGIENNSQIEILDSQPNLQPKLDFENVPKYEMSTEDYEKLDDSVLSYKKRNKLGRFGESDKMDTTDDDLVKIKGLGIEEGKRCEVDLGDGSMRKRGTIRFIGATEFQSGVWIGVEYDEPVGKNNGSVKGVKYFECNPNYGGFVKYEKIKVGDYPPLLDLELDDDDMDEF